jgi:catechol 2,3-dioxygenase-like lactoylglutathione lyase family enzyme
MSLWLEGFAPLLQVFDMPTSVAFYRDVLGFELVETSPRRGSEDSDDFDWCLLRRDGIDLMLNTAYEVDQRPIRPPAERVAVHDDTALFFGCRDLDAAYRHLRAHGVAAEEPRTAPYGMRQVWLRDPDGYVVCLQWRAAT